MEGLTQARRITVCPTLARPACLTRDQHMSSNGRFDASFDGGFDGMPVIGLAHVQHMSNTGERTDQPLQAQALILCCHNVRYGLDCPASRGPWCGHPS